MMGPSRELLLRRDKIKDARIGELEAMLHVAWSDIDDDFPDVVSEGDYEGWTEDLRRRAGKEGTP